mmetsp:Transcript_12500/g.21643  ORF Transcript_12500/g.21643 Transcript_12500/m.21643 type:complete len:224 (+) Transcript_12500:2-673(+)
MELRSSSGSPLHINPEVVSYPANYSDEPYVYNEKMVEYGSISDIIYAESDSNLCVRATKGACFAQHGATPEPSGKIPTQSLSVMRMDPSVRVDRYQVSLNQKIDFERALGGEESAPEQAPLFAVVDTDGETPGLLTALEDCRVIIVGCLSSLLGYKATLYKNDKAIVHSQVCKGSGHGSHSLNGVVELKKNDRISINAWGKRDMTDAVTNCGHLAFIVMNDSD